MKPSGIVKEFYLENAYDVQSTLMFLADREYKEGEVFLNGIVVSGLLAPGQGIFNSDRSDVCAAEPGSNTRQLVKP